MIRWRAEAGLFLATLRDGLRLFRLAPLIPLFAILPEFAQHVVEIRIGMFDNLAAFQALALDETRLSFGSVKVAGLWIALLLASRYWRNAEDGRPWWSLSTVAWRPLLLAIALSLVAAVPTLPVFALPPTLTIGLSLVILVATLPLLVLMMAGLLGDHAATLRGVYREGWGKALRIGLFLLVACLPLIALHTSNHTFALGKPTPLVWALMAWDALVVGAMATIAGTVQHHAYFGPDRARFTGA